MAGVLPVGFAWIVATVQGIGFGTASILALLTVLTIWSFILLRRQEHRRALEWQGRDRYGELRTLLDSLADRAAGASIETQLAMIVAEAKATIAASLGEAAAESFGRHCGQAREGKTVAAYLGGLSRNPALGQL